MAVRSKIKLILLCFFGFFILVTSACEPSKKFVCTDSIACIDIEQGKPIEIGVLQVLHGDLKDSGLMQVQGVKLALDHYNQQLLGHPILLHVEDSGCSAEMGTNAAFLLSTKPKIVGIIGTYCSSAAVAAIPIISNAGMVMISGTNSAPSLTSIGGKAGKNWHPGYYRTMYNGITMAEMAATFAFKELGIKKAATINDGERFTLELTDEFERIFNQLGGKIVRSIGMNKGDTNLKPLLEAIAYSKPDVLYFPLFEPEAKMIINQIGDVPGLEHIKLIGSGGARSERFLKDIGTSGIGLYMTITQNLAGDAYRQLLSDYESKYNDKPYHFSLPYIYDATNILLTSIQSVAIKEPDGSLHIGRNALREAIYKTTNFQGVTGNLSCDQFGDLFSGDYAIIQYLNPSEGLEGFNANIIYIHK